jgi:hypothetical protein
MFFSCSSDDSSSSSVPEGFTLIIDGETINVTSVQAYRFDNWMEVAGYGSNGKSIDFKFSTAGSLYDAFVFSIDSENPFGPKSTFEYYNENTFNFDLVSYDANTRRVSVNFSGKVYDDEYDHTSDFSTVSGSFNVEFTNQDVLMAGFGTTAKINGNDWDGMSFDTSDDNTVTELHVLSSGKYFFDIVYESGNPIVGNYSFANNTAIRGIRFYEYDVNTHEIINYNVSGSVNFTECTNYYVKGTFSLTATHPTSGAIINVTQGVFKESF